MISPFIYFVNQQRSLIFYLILFLSNSVGTDLVHAQGSDACDKMDTLKIFNGRIKMKMKAAIFHKMKKERVVEMYKSLFETTDMLNCEGFITNEGATLRFYQTTIDKPVANDNGLSDWKLIASFTDKIPESQWIESGWERISNGHLYFVRLLSHKKPEQLFKFVFFYIDNKLTFSLLQSPGDKKGSDLLDKYINIAAGESHP